MALFTQLDHWAGIFLCLLSKTGWEQSDNMGLTPGRAACLKKRNPAVSNYDITHLKPHNQGLSVIYPSLRISNTTTIFCCCLLAFLRQVCCCVCRILFESGEFSRALLKDRCSQLLGSVISFSMPFLCISFHAISLMHDLWQEDWHSSKRTRSTAAVGEHENNFCKGQANLCRSRVHLVKQKIALQKPNRLNHA